MTREHYRVSGMTCAHCEQSVARELVKLPSVSDVRVKLVAGGNSTVMVISEQPVPIELVSAAIAEAGYELVDQAQPAHRTLPLADSGSTCCA